MKLALSEAATLLGQSERQLRYQIKTGRLEATKQGHQWRIDSAALPLTEDQRQALAARSRAAREAFEQGLEPAAKAASSAKGDKKDAAAKGYSVTDMIVFQVGQAVYRELCGALGETHAAARHLFTALDFITRGCHSFHPPDKVRRFTEARELAATAVTDLLLHGTEDDERCQALARRIEHDLIPKIGGLVASQEKRSRRQRFDHFGSTVQPR